MSDPFSILSQFWHPMPQCELLYMEADPRGVYKGPSIQRWRELYCAMLCAMRDDQ